MKACCKVAIIILMAITINGISAPHASGQSTVLEQSDATNEQQAIYASISDTEVPADETSQVTYETLSDQADMPKSTISDIHGTTPDLTTYTQRVFRDDHPFVDDKPVADSEDREGATADVELVSLTGSDDIDGTSWSVTCDMCDAEGCLGCDVAAGPPCDGQCAGGCLECCSVGPHCTSVYGEFLYLRPRNAEVAYAVPVDGPILAPPVNVPLQLGGLGIVDPDYEPGFRAGFNLALDATSSFQMSYSMFESYTSDQITAITPPQVLLSLVAHPSSTSAITNFVSARAELEIDYDVIDASYRHRLACRELFAVDYVLGARYAKLEQQFNTLFIDGGTETVRTDIDFDGAGVRLGLETERHSCRSGLHVFAKGYASLVAGRFRGSYFQGQSFDPVVVDTNWEAGRVVPILDLEMGVAWSSKGGRLRLASGYQVSAWFNTLKTQEFIYAIQGSEYADLGQTMTFDGLTARAEFRF